MKVKGVHLCRACQKAEGTIHDELREIISVPLCEGCLAASQYLTANTLRMGRVCRYPPFSVEFEIHADSWNQQRALILLKHHYLRTRDTTVSDEYKSPIYQSLNVFCDHLRILHDLRDLVDRRCGTHLHVAFPSHLRTLLKTYVELIFGPLRDYLVVHPQETSRFGGGALVPMRSNRLATAMPGYVWARNTTLSSIASRASSKVGNTWKSSVFVGKSLRS